MTRVTKPRPAATIDRDPVVAYAAMLGQAWEDHGDGGIPETSPQREECEEAYARIEAFEAVIAVTKANTLTGAAVQVLLASTELRNCFHPEEPGAEVDPARIRQFYTMIRQLDYALLTIIHAGGVDLQALGLAPYMYKDVLTGAARVTAGAWRPSPCRGEGAS